MSSLIQHYDAETGSATPDWLRACREIEADCEPISPLGLGPMLPESPALASVTKVPAEILNDPMARAVMRASLASRASYSSPRAVIFDFASSEYDESMEAARWMDAYAVGNFGQYDRCHHFCAEQNSLQARGFRIVEVATNIYGYVVRDTHNDGMGSIYGGRQRPGTTKDEVIEWARKWHAERPTHRKVIAGYEELAARQADPSDDDKTSCLKDEARAEARELARMDAYDELGVGL